MAKRRRRKITIKNSSLFAFFALISLFLLEENSAYQHQNPYRHNIDDQQQNQHYNQQKHHYITNQAQSFGGGLNVGGGSLLGHEEKASHLRSSQSSYVHQKNFQESPMHNPQQQQQPALLSSSYHANNNNDHYQQQQPNNPSHREILPTAHLCSNLPTQLARQLKLCKLISHSPSADDVVSLGASKGLAECRSQFKHDRWNCTHTAGDHQLLTSELTQSIGNPESGFIHAIAAAGIVHSIATACSVGNLSDCTCDKSRVGTIAKRDEQPTHWKWGGCSNNIRHGMMFAKHLVELLDAVHQHSRMMQQQQEHHHHHLHHQHRQQQHHQLSKRSTIMVRDHLFSQRPPEAIAQLQPGDHLILGSSSSTAAQRDFCQQNHNISQAKHHELIKSLLSRNSLEKHQEFRLAMNMHNNKIGRMAVAKNMELHCRCHGLSGSCSLKTCWLSLPSFQVIGKYLKKKYESSVHLPKAVNLNKLIPMMDRQEISAILSSQESASSLSSSDPSSSSGATEFFNQDHPTQEQQQQQPPSQYRSPEYAALVQGADGSNDGDNHYEQVEQTPVSPITTTMALNGSLTLNPNQTAAGEERLGLYERHKHHRSQTTVTAATTTTTVAPQQQQQVEIPNNLEPLSQQQYQALLKDMKLCNTVRPGGGHLQTRDLHQLTRRQKHHQQQQQQQLLNGQQTKQANQQLSHLLPVSDKDELIHLHKSPKYCDADLRHGFVGIQSRICSNKENAPDNCDRLCCGRGHRTVILQNYSSCNCKFQYCCTVTCSVCAQQSVVLVCN